MEILDCGSYLAMYQNKWKESYNEAVENGSDDPGYDASMIFEEGCTPEEVVGYYLYYYEDEALRQWKGNIDGIELDEHSKEVDRILKALNERCKVCEMNKKVCRYCK